MVSPLPGPILIVEDDKKTASLVALYLEREGFHSRRKSHLVFPSPLKSSEFQSLPNLYHTFTLADYYILLSSPGCTRPGQKKSVKTVDP
jgi:CheY-like chemotaxis protein